jgi:hypothetical protein
MGMHLPEHARINHAAWDVSAADHVEAARRNRAAEEISWGIWDVPEAHFGALPEDCAPTPGWARRWPVEEICSATRAGA